MKEISGWCRRIDIKKKKKQPLHSFYTYDTFNYFNGVIVCLSIFL